MAVTIASRFQDVKGRSEKALVAFVTAGDPPLDQLPAVIEALAEGGADVIELGVPFSDPVADGPTIQASSRRALELGVTPKAVLVALSNCPASVPVVLMGYYNPVLRFGLREFAEAASLAGASGTIVSDLTPEEATDWVAASRASALDTIFLAAPTSTDERLDAVADLSTGFVYAVSRTGVTGASAALPPEALELVARLKSRTSQPVCVGFGISKPEHVRAVCEVADGAVVGSALVSLLDSEWDGGRGHGKIIKFVSELKSATRC